MFCGKRTIQRGLLDLILNDKSKKVFKKKTQEEDHYFVIEEICGCKVYGCKDTVVLRTPSFY